MSSSKDNNIIITDKFTQDPNFEVEDDVDVDDLSDLVSDQNSKEVKDADFKNKITRSDKIRVQRGNSLMLQMKGFFLPAWNEAGGRNKQLIREFIKVPEGQITKYCRFKINQMNFNEITPYLNNTLRYPLYVCVDKLDAFLFERQGQTSGFDKRDLPSKKFFKEYLLHIDPSDELNCWCSFNTFKGLSKSGRLKYIIFV